MYRTVAQLDSLTNLLSQVFPDLCTRLRLPEPSVQGRTVYALRIRAGDNGDRRGVLLVGGTHARELMNPDLLIELAVDLVVSYLTGNDLVFGNRTWPASELKLILDTLDIYLLPCSNPDGREFVMTGADRMWRKNRRDNLGTTCDGVDLNRNLQILWGVVQGSTSCSPCSDTYVGTSAFSEPETRNVRHLLDTYRIECFADVHSYSELVLYPWGHAPAQTTDPSMNFTTLPTGTCQPIGVPNYREYMPPSDLLRFETVGKRIVEAIADVRGRQYTLQPSVALYPTTGTHSDYAYSRHIADPALRKVYGFTLETGPFVGNALDSFQPSNPEPIKDEVESGLIALMQQCICAIDIIGASFLARDDEVVVLRTVRDEVLGGTQAGREWIALFERIQTPLLDVVLTDRSLGQSAADILGRSGAILADESSIFGQELADDTLALLNELRERTDSDEARSGLRIVRERLGQFVGQSTREILRNLAAVSPLAEPDGV